MKFNEYFKLKDITINVTNSCNLNCCYCVSGNTQIIMNDLTTKPIKDIKLGDKIVAFNENTEYNKHRKLKTAEVIHIFEPRYVEKLYRIKTNNNELLITGEHPLLDGRNKWITVNTLFNKSEKIIKEVNLPIYSTDFSYSDDYKIGYIVSCWLGDGSYKKYKCKNFKNKKLYDGIRIRFAVKDDDIIIRLKQFMNDFGFSYNLRNFKISSKFNIIKEGIFSNTLEVYNKLVSLIEDNLNKNTNPDYLRGFLAGIYDCEGSYGKDGQLKISNGNPEIIQQIKTALDYFNYKYTLKKSKTCVNMPIYIFRLLKKSINSFLINVYPACYRKRIKYENHYFICNEQIISIEEIDFNDYVYNIETTEHTYIANNILVHNCFEHNKNGLKMSTDMVEKIIDKSYENYLLNNETKFPFVVNFFGGEPFLAFDVIEHAMKYAKSKKYNISFGVTTNLTMLSDHMLEVIEEYELGLLVSVDGIKKIHDRNRCNSYDIVISNLKKLIDNGLKHLIEIRMTVMPEDLNDLLSGIQELYDLGIDNIAPVPVTDTKWNDADYINLRDEMSKIWEWAFSIYNDENNKRNLSIKCIDDYLEMVLCPEILLSEQRKVCTAGTFSSCSFGVNGDILPCHQRHTIAEHYNELVMGNVNDDNIKEVSFNKQTIENENKNCDCCNARAVCRGGCPSENLTLNKNGNIMNDVQCKVLCQMVDVAQQYQWWLLNDILPNIRSRKLNILSQNLKLLEMLLNIIREEKSIRDNEIELLKFYEKLTDNEDILLPNFREAINFIINGMVNIIMNKLEDEGE